MKTIIFKDKTEDIKKAGQIIKGGGLVAFPTETVYGLGADGLNPEAVKKVYKAKGRPSDNPMILHISHVNQVYEIAETVTQEHLKLMEAFWPGPMTVVMNCKDVVPKETTGGLATVGIRLPRTESARKLIDASGTPIAAPSANLSGKPSPTKASHVLDDLDGRIDAIIEGGDCQVGIESTVLTIKDGKVIILRPGLITPNDIAKVVNLPVEFDPALTEGVGKNFKPMAPGMKYKHYAPDGQMIIYSGSEEKIKGEIQKKKQALEAEGKSVGVIFFGSDNVDTAAHDLFAKLRQMDKENIEYILAGAVSEDGLGFSVMNRMLKSAGYNVVNV